MATNIRSESLRNIFENALSGVPDGHHIVKYDDAIKKRMAADIIEHKKEIEIMRNKLINTLANPNMWRINDTVKGNKHTGRVGKTGCGLTINKKDFSKGGRLYVLKYYDDSTNSTYVMLVGYQLSHQRKIGWREEVKEIISRFGGELFDDIKEEIDEIERMDRSSVNDMHGGYFNAGDGSLTEKKTNILLHEGNMTITDDQFAKIMTNPPLLIDGHAGTGKSIIIALRIAFNIYYYDKEKKRARPKLLVVAYNQKVLDNIQKFAEYWIERLIEGNIAKSYFDCIEYIPTLNLYHSLMKKIDREQTPKPDEAKFVARYVSFYKFESVFFERHRNNPSRISAEECWHFIRGIMKGQGFGWLGDDEITIEDFASQTPEGKIQKRFTQHMPRDLIEANLDLFSKYEDWRTDNYFLDDIDLVRRAGEGIEKEPHGEMLGQYTNIFIDEAQDLTTEEYKLIIELLDDKEKVKLIVGGDPLQTINPTGFSWNVLQAFIISIIGTKNKIKPERMLVSHRMPNNLVKMANVIITARNNLLPSEINDLMEAHSTSNELQGLIQTVRYDESDISQNNEMQEFITEILPKNVGILLWARDRGELIDLGEKDKAISSLKKDLGKSVIDIHSIESVKGLEYEAVVLYRFADLDSNFSKIETILDSPEDTTTDALYHDLYFLNRLFIALTRSKKNIYIIDSEDNIKQFWNNTLWSSSIDASVEFSTFMEDFDVEPSLDKARQYFESAKNKRDSELMQRALASAKKCEQSDERDKLIDEIEMNKTTLEIQEARARGDKAEVKVLTEKMIQIYDKHGDVLLATYERIKSGLWDDLKEVLDKNCKIPEIILINKFINIRYKHSVKDLEHMIDGGIGLIRDNDVRKILLNDIREFSKTYMKKFKTDKDEINVNIIKKLQKPPYNFQHNTILQRLMTPWIEDGSNGQKSKNLGMAISYVKTIRKIWSDIELYESKVPRNARIIYYNHLNNNPNRGDSEGERYVDALTLLGDKNAARRTVRKLFQEKEKFSITDNIWGKILTLLTNDEDTKWTKHTEFHNRLRKAADLQKWTTINALNSAQSFCKEEEHEYDSGLELLDSQKIAGKIMAGLYDLQPDDKHNMLKEIVRKFLPPGKIKLLINGKNDLLEKLITVFKGAKKEALMMTILKNCIENVPSKNTEYNGNNIFMILENIGTNQKHLVGSKNSFYLKVAEWLDKENLLDWIRKSKLIIPYDQNMKLPDELMEKVTFMRALRNEIDNGKPSEKTYNSFLLNAQKLGMIDVVKELLPHANATEQVKLKNHLLIQNPADLKKYTISKIYEILKDDIKQIKWGDVSWENSGWACLRGTPTLLLQDVKYPKSYENQPLITMLTGHTVSDLFYEIMISMFLGKNMNNIAKAVIPEGFKNDFFTKKLPSIRNTIQDNNEENHHWSNIERLILPEITPPPSSRQKMDGFSLICLSVIDALVLYEEITKQTKRIKFAKSLGVKDIKNGTSKPDTIKLILGTDLFQYVFKEIPNLETSVKGILDF